MITETNYLMLASGYTIDKPSYEMAKQTIKHSQLWRDFYAAWVEREKAWNTWRDCTDDNDKHAAYNFRNGLYSGLRLAVIDVYGWNTFIDILRVFEDEKGFKIQ